MNELSSTEVPHKFAEWLLAMGCHPEIVPPVEKVAEKCRGQYYMVWRSLMERIQSRNVIKNKRIQVFCDDVRRCQKNNVLNERDSNTVVPEELLLWHQHTQMKEKVADAEATVRKEKQENLQQLADKANSKMCQRYLLRKSLQDRQRQTLLLQRLAEKLRTERTNLLEAKTIAESLCGVNEDTDVESTVDKCIASLTRQGAATGNTTGASLASGASPASTSTLASTSSDNNDEEVLSSLARCRGELVFKQLYERRAGLCAAIPASHPGTSTNTKGVRSVVCHTASLHCSLALETMKNRIHVDRTFDKLGKTFMQLGNYLSQDACELLVTRCEVACSEARVTSLRRSAEEVASREGVFASERPRDGATTTTPTIQAVDKTIECKRDELKRLIASSAAVERKTQCVRERLKVRFNGFDGGDRDRFGGSASLPAESMSTLRQFYEEKREKSRKKPNLSMNFDTSDNVSFNDMPDDGQPHENPTLIDELKLFLNKFSLDKNRKIILESGEKIWIFESISASLNYFHTKCQGGDMTTSLLCPSVALKQNLRRLAELTGSKEQLETLLRPLEAGKRYGPDIDISQSKVEEEKTLDRIRKRLDDNMVSLQKTSRTLDVGVENLQLWSANGMKKYISDMRKVDGKSYIQYEKAYLSS